MEHSGVRISGRNVIPASETVLLVEDDVHDVELMKEAFRAAQSPFTLRCVSHGGEAIQYLCGEGDFADREQSPRPVLILLDLQMPLVDGFEVLRWIQAQPSEKVPPVIVLSYSKLDEDQRLARQLGAKRFIVKPVDFNEAVEFVKSLVEFSCSAALSTCLNPQSASDSLTG